MSRLKENPPSVFHTRPSVCLVHGLWMKGYEMYVLEKRLQARGFRTARFSYASMACTIEENAHRLHRFLKENAMQECFFASHSYGGLVTCTYLGIYGSRRPTRVVFLGSPISGATLVSKLEGLGILRLLTGKSLEPLKRGCFPAPDEHRCAMIAGNLNLGLGMFFLKGPADGLVTVSDTMAPWLEKHVLLKCSHLALLFSKKATTICADFLAEND